MAAGAIRFVARFGIGWSAKCSGQAEQPRSVTPQITLPLTTVVLLVFAGIVFVSSIALPFFRWSRARCGLIRSMCKRRDIHDAGDESTHFRQNGDVPAMRLLVEQLITTTNDPLENKAGLKP